MKTRAINLTTGAVIVCGGLVLLAAGVLSFSALYDLFLTMGLFAAWLAWLFPLLFDLAEVTAALAVWNHKLRGRENGWAWNRVIDFTLLGVGANVIHALYAWMEGRIAAHQSVLAIFLTALFPVSVALITHLLKQTIDLHVSDGRVDARRVDDALAELREVIDSVRGLTAGTAEKEQKKADLLAFVRDNPHASYAQMGDAVGRAKTTVRDYVNELREDGLLKKNGQGWEVR